MDTNSLISFRPYLLDPVPVTVFCGLPGAGKSEVITQVAQFIQFGENHRKTQTLSDHSLFKADTACAHCGVTQALQDELKRRIREECPDYFLVEVPVECDPRSVAHSFSGEVQKQYQSRQSGVRSRPSRQSSLDALVSVIDVSSFAARLNSQQSLGVDFPGLKVSQSEVLQDSTADILAASIETCDVLLLHRFQAVSPDFMLSLESCLRALQPRAKIVRAEVGNERLWVPEILGTRLFDAEKTEESSTWRQALKKCPPESRTAQGSAKGEWLPVEIWTDVDPELWTVALVRRFRPFHPERLAQVLDGWSDLLLRTVGQVWLATDGSQSYHLGQIGPSPVFFHPDAPWAVTAPISDQQAIRREEPELDRIWDAGHGDRFNEIVLVGPRPAIEEAVAAFDYSLLTDAEMKMDWTKFRDPFHEEILAQEMVDQVQAEQSSTRRPRKEVPWLKLVKDQPGSELN
jgi:G3E family GTPase